MRCGGRSWKNWHWTLLLLQDHWCESSGHCLGWPGTPTTLLAALSNDKRRPLSSNFNEVEGPLTSLFFTKLSHHNILRWNLDIKKYYFLSLLIRKRLALNWLKSDEIGIKLKEKATCGLDMLSRVYFKCTVRSWLALVQHSKELFCTGLKLRSKLLAQQQLRAKQRKFCATVIGKIPSTFHQLFCG